MNLLAVDPGKSGGIAYTDSDGVTHALPMPPTCRDLHRTLEILARPPATCFLEDLPLFQGVLTPRSIAVLFRNLGQIEGVLSALGCRIEYLTPRMWQSTLRLGTAADHGKRWKAHLRSRAQALHPHLHVTLKTADALLLLEAGFRIRTHAPAA